MSTNDQETYMVENARLIFRNFVGKEGMYNRAGQRNFSVIIPEEDVQVLLDNEWNVKYTKPKEEGEDPVPYLPVEVSYKNRPPNVVLITESGRTQLSEEMIETLDYADIRLVDLIVNPYDWSMPSGATGRKAYLKSMFVTINEDELEKKYARMERLEEQRG